MLIINNINFVYFVLFLAEIVFFSKVASSSNVLKKVNVTVSDMKNEIGKNQTIVL